MWVRYVNPESALGIPIMLDVLLMVIIGGIGTLDGGVVGAALLLTARTLLPNLRGLGGALFAGSEILQRLSERWLLYFGILFMLVVFFFPRGVLGTLREAAARAARARVAGDVNRSFVAPFGYAGPENAGPGLRRHRRWGPASGASPSPASSGVKCSSWIGTRSAAVQTSACGTPLWVPETLGVSESVLQVHDRLVIRTPTRDRPVRSLVGALLHLRLPRVLPGSARPVPRAISCAPRCRGSRTGAVVTGEGRFTAPVIVDCSGWRRAITGGGGDGAPLAASLLRPRDPHPVRRTRGSPSCWTAGSSPRGSAGSFRSAAAA